MANYIYFRSEGWEKYPLYRKKLQVKVKFPTKMSVDTYVYLHTE